MKKIVLLFVCLNLISCANQEDSQSVLATTKSKLSVYNFVSQEELDKKIDEIVQLKQKKEESLFAKYTSLTSKKTSDKYSSLDEAIVINNLKNYHSSKLKVIYELREELNFTSIQSIADEINSLYVLDSIQSNVLFNKHRNILIKDQFEVRTIFDSRLSNVINSNGELLYNGVPFNDRSTSNTNQTAKYIGDEAIKSGIAGSVGNFYVYYYAGREVHKNFIGVKYFRYFTQLKAFMLTPLGMVSYPAVFTVDPKSIAGFAQTKSQFFSTYDFTYGYPSGTGTTVRFVGGDKNTPYVPVGGNIKGKFTATMAGVIPLIVNCDIKYTEK